MVGAVFNHTHIYPGLVGAVFNRTGHRFVTKKNYRINFLIFIQPHRFLDCVSVFPVLVGMFCPRRSSLGDYRVLVGIGAVANRSYRAWGGFWWKTETVANRTYCAWGGFWWKTERLQTAPTGVGGRDDGAGEWLQTAPTRSGAASDDPPTKKSP